MHGDGKEKLENCPSCRAAGRNLKTRISHTEINRHEILNEPNHENQLDFAGPINTKRRRDGYILVKVDRISKWPKTQISDNPHRQR